MGRPHKKESNTMENKQKRTSRNDHRHKQTRNTNTDDHILKRNAFTRFIMTLIAIAIGGIMLLLTTGCTPKITIQEHNKIIEQCNTQLLKLNETKQPITIIENITETKEIIKIIQNNPGH